MTGLVRNGPLVAYNYLNARLAILWRRPAAP